MLKDPLQKFLMPPDTRSRHEAVAKLLSVNRGELLDVGGNRGELELFAPELEITTINIEGEDSDLVFDGSALPFESETFDSAVSLDVLEHIQPADRRQHVSELLRVARTEVVICCPFGTSEHIEAERMVADSYEGLTGGRHRFLDEHISIGLPTKSELRQIIESSGFDSEIFFQGDFRQVNELFLKGVTFKARPGLRAAASYLAARLRATRGGELELTSNEFTNRVFLRIRKPVGSHQ